MSISAISNGSVQQAPEVRRVREAPDPRPAEEERIVPEERAFDRYEPEDKQSTTTCDTVGVDRELENLRKRQEQLEEQLRAAAPEQAAAIRQQLDQVSRELAQKDNDSYRRQHAVFS